jgi:hypothetical protein
MRSIDPPKSLDVAFGADNTSACNLVVQYVNGWNMMAIRAPAAAPDPIVPTIHIPYPSFLMSYLKYGRTISRVKKAIVGCGKRLRKFGKLPRQKARKPSSRYVVVKQLMIPVYGVESRFDWTNLGCEGAKVRSRFCYVECFCNFGLNIEHHTS